MSIEARIIYDVVLFFQLYGEFVLALFVLYAIITLTPKDKQEM